MLSKTPSSIKVVSAAAEDFAVFCHDGEAISLQLTGELCAKDDDSFLKLMKPWRWQDIRRGGGCGLDTRNLSASTEPPNIAPSRINPAGVESSKTWVLMSCMVKRMVPNDPDHRPRDQNLRKRAVEDQRKLHRAP